VVRGELAIQQDKKVIKCAKKMNSPRRGMGAKKQSKAIQPNTVTRERIYKKKAVGQYTPGTPKKNKKVLLPCIWEKLKLRVIRVEQ
jgi:hypothetical protein